MEKQTEINRNNEQFWNTICGTNLANHLGIKDSTPESLDKFDSFYFQMYPYLKKYLPAEQLRGKRVLEIGLGYGTLSQYLAGECSEYYGLDIAENAVSIVQLRLQQSKNKGLAQVGNMLECPFDDNYFDMVVSIGCFHHTGNTQKCIDETYRILKPGGTAVLMVYNKFSFRQWHQWPKATFKNWLSSFINHYAVQSSYEQRLAYDSSSDATIAAPETEFFSKSELKRMTRHFSSQHIYRENFDDQVQLKLWPLGFVEFGSREPLLNSLWSKLLGLDLYVVLKK